MSTALHKLNYRELKGENHSPELWATRLKNEIMYNDYLIKSEENFVRYFGLCKYLMIVLSNFSIKFGSEDTNIVSPYFVVQNCNI